QWRRAEALAACVLIVVLDTPVAREVYGDAAWYVPRDGDVRSASVAIMTLLDDAAARRRLLDRAPAILARYSWDVAASETLTAIEGIVRSRCRSYLYASMSAPTIILYSWILR